MTLDTPTPPAYAHAVVSLSEFIVCEGPGKETTPVPFQSFRQMGEWFKSYVRRDSGMQPAQWVVTDAGTGGSNPPLVFFSVGR